MPAIKIGWKALLSGGLMASLAFTAVVLTSFWIEPLAWVGDFPAEVQAAAGIVPERAMQVGLLSFLALMAVLIGFPTRLILKIRRESLQVIGFKGLFTHVFLLMMMVNAWDFFIVDLLIFDAIHPAFMQLPGLEQEVQTYTTPAFHAQASLQAIPVMAFLSALIAGAGRWIKPQSLKNGGQSTQNGAVAGA